MASEASICAVGDAGIQQPAALLCILDGFGLEKPAAYNAISLAKTPCLDNLFEQRPWTSLGASGKDVGLPEGQMGNSEVGHLNIGAGRVVYLGLSHIDKCIEDGSFYTNPVFIDTFSKLEMGASLHIMGLYSDGCVHSSLKHIQELIRLVCDKHREFPALTKLRLHLFTDGRDVEPQSAYDFMRDLGEFLDGLHCPPELDIQLASITGRYYAMDRDKRWERVERAYNAIVHAHPVHQGLVDKGAYGIAQGLEYIQSMYDQGVYDEFIEPCSLSAEPVQPGDAFIFCNFRPDRARELSAALVQKSFLGFERGEAPQLSSYVCMTEYDPKLESPVAFPVIFPTEVLADVLSRAGLRQFHAAETEKYAHVTFFLNGGQEEPKEGEERLLIDSPKVETYDLKPEMSAVELTDAVCEAMRARKADAYIVNYANCDMVGHTGVLEAAVAAVETVDSCLDRLLRLAAEMQIEVLVTADHGNADIMYTGEGEKRKPLTSHTTNRVPFIYVGKRDMHVADWAHTEGRLCDIAPTFLSLLDLEAPASWEGRRLLEQ